MASMRRKVSLAVLLVLIVVLGITFFRVVAPFLLPLFLAGMTAVVCQPLFRYFLMRTKDRIPLAAAVTTGTIMAALMIPLTTGVLIATLQLYTFASRISSEDLWLRIFLTPEVSQAIESELEEELAEEEEQADVSSESETSESEENVVESETDLIEGDEKIPSDPQTTADVVTANEPIVTEEIEAQAPQNDEPSVPQTLSPKLSKGETAFAEMVDYVNTWLPPALQRTPNQVASEIRMRVRTTMLDIGDRSLGRTAGTTIGILTGLMGMIVTALVGLMMYIVSLYYFLADGTTLLLAAEKLIPVHAKYQRQLLEQFAVVVRSVVVATFLAAFAQGIATTAALWFFGFDHLFVLLILATVSALIPIAGTWLVWVPCAIILFASGHWVQALLLCIYGAAFVGFLDNVVRTYVLNSDTKLHPLLAFISILGGLQVMGLWGVFIGPIVASCLHALVKIFNHELLELTKEKDLTEVVPPT